MLTFGAVLIAGVWMSALVLITVTDRNKRDRTWAVAASLGTAVPVVVVTVAVTGRVWASLLSAATAGAAMAVLLLHGGPRTR
ncbi:hypothetical protein AMK27_39860 [Streptomyces sp. CB02009]|uniref:hypothetical protein n=1 Tax=Streptomyces sp. CB02009 TaxID=1703938 RepID=UPI00093B0E38|nr:hypothetical protein [Streptomyces sp. CB02009]OKJ46783.1 hypothetical protein AMK27_39860 [Streptomyces sp. CB02009]